MLNFDPTIKLGDLLTIASFVGIGIAAFYNIKGRLDVGAIKMSNMTTEIHSIKENIKSTTEALTVLAIQKVEIEHIKQDIYELKHGEGFVLPLMKSKG